MNPFTFSLNQSVTIKASGEQGIIVGRSEYTFCNPSYLVRYKASDGRAVENWWTEDSLE